MVIFVPLTRGPEPTADPADRPPARPRPAAVVSFRPNLPDPGETEISRPFVAKYAGLCAGCGEPINPGDEACTVGRTLFHAQTECTDNTEARLIQ